MVSVMKTFVTAIMIIIKKTITAARTQEKVRPKASLHGCGGINRKRIDVYVEEGGGC